MEKESVEKETWQADEIAAVMMAEQIGAVNHRHLEGVLSPNDLRELSRGTGVEMDEEIWVAIEKIMKGSSENPNLMDFINKLSTRWIRIMMLKGVMEGKSSAQVLGPVMDRVLEKAFGEGIGDLELLASPLALAFEGNPSKISDPSRPARPGMPEPEFDTEKQVLEAWLYRLEGDTLPDSDKFLTMESYAQLFRERVKANPNYVWEGEPRASEKQMAVSLRVCLRRNEIPEQVLSNQSDWDSSEGKKMVDRLIAMKKAGLIVGIDLAGIEGMGKYAVENFSTMFDQFREAGVGFTVHAGELKQEEGGDLAYRNLKTAIGLGAKRLGHAVRLYDNDNSTDEDGGTVEGKMVSLLREAIDKGVFFEVNAISNLWTGVVGDLEEHPIYAALRGEHPLTAGEEGKEVINKLLDLICINDDDPVVTEQKGGRSMAEEFAAICKATDNFGGRFIGVKEMLTHFRENMRKAKLK